MRKLMALRWQPFVVALLMLVSRSGRAQEPRAFVPPAPAVADTPARAGIIQSPRVVGPAVTLESLQQTAIQNNPTLEQARATIHGARGRQYQVGRKPNPTIGYMATEIGNDDRAGQQGGFVEQEFVRGCKLELNQNIVGREVQQAEQIYSMQELRVRNAVRREFYAVLVAERRRELAGELVRIAGEAREATDARMKREEGTLIELRQSDTEFETASLLLYDADREREAAWRRMQSVVNQSDLAPSPLAGDLEHNLPELTWEQSRNMLLETSPELSEARYAIARAQAKSARARVEPTPNVFIQASTQYDASSRNTIAGLQIGLPIPIHNDNRGNVVDADAEIIRAAREVDRLQLSLQSRLADVFRDYQLGRQRVNRYRDAILPASRESLDLSRTAFDKGELGYLELLTAQRIYAEKNREFVSALAAFWDSVVDIEGLLLTDGLDAPRTVGER